MRWTVKLVLCFLIAWLPLTGFAASTVLCPHTSSMTSFSHTAAPYATDMRASGPASATHQPACHGSAGSLSCTVFAVPTEMSAPRVAASPMVYTLLDSTLFSQFIPDLPQRPPLVL